jgi:hypothetical protein
MLHKIVIAISVVSLTLRKLFLWCHGHRWNWTNKFYGLHPYETSLSQWFQQCHWYRCIHINGSLTPLKSFQQCHWHCWNCFNVLIDMVLMVIQQENGIKQAEFLKNVTEFFRNWPNFRTSLAGRPCCDLATVIILPLLLDYSRIITPLWKPAPACSQCAHYNIGIV